MNKILKKFLAVFIATMMIFTSTGFADAEISSAQPGTMQDMSTENTNEDNGAFNSLETEVTTGSVQEIELIKEPIIEANELLLKKEKKEAVFVIERASLGQAFYMEPTVVEFNEGDNVASVLVELLGEDNYRCTGSPDSSFYLSAVKLNDSLDENIPQHIIDMGLERSSIEVNDDEWLGEFDYAGMSGWMYWQNHVMKNVGMSDSELNSNDVIRLQFTVYGYGQDLGVGFEGDSYVRANKDDLVRTLAYINKDKSVLASDETLKAAYDKGMELMMDMTATQDVVDQAVAEIKNPPVEKTDKSKLSSAISQAEKINKETYTTDSVINFEKEFTGAKTINEKTGAKQSEIDAAIINLKNSILNLEKEEIKSQWPLFRGNEENHGLVNSELPVPGDDIETKWIQKYGSGWSGNGMSSIIVDDSIYIVGSNKLQKRSLVDGSLIKEESIPNGINFYSNLGYGNGSIYVPSSKGTITAFDAKTLDCMWTSESAGSFQNLSAIQYKDGIVYAGFTSGGTSGGVFAAFNGVTGEVEWKYGEGTSYYQTGAVIFGESVLFAGDDGKLVSANARTGEEIDTVDLGGGVRCIPVKYDGHVYLTTKSGYVYKIGVNSDGSFGEELSYEEGTQGTTSPVIYNGRVYAGFGGMGTGGKVAVLNDADMSLVYEAALPGPTQSSPVLTTAYATEKNNNKIYIYFALNNASGTIVCLEDDDTNIEPKVTSIYQPDPKQYSMASPIAGTDGTIYYTNDSGNIFALAKKENKKDFKLEIDKSKLILGEKANVSAKDNGKDMELSTSGITWTATPQDIATIDSNTGEVRTLKSGTVILTGMLKNYPETAQSLELTVEPFISYVRVEGDSNTIAPLAEVKVTDLDLSKYDINTKFTEPKPIHVIIQALQNVGIDCADSDQGMNHNNGTYIDMIDGLETFSTGPLDGWMYFVDNTWANLGVSGYKIHSGQSIVMFFVEDYSQNSFTWFDKENADILENENLKLNLSGPFYDVNKDKSEYGPIDNATIYVDGKEYKCDDENVKTDKDGNVSLSFDNPGTYVISADRKNEKTGKSNITRPYCKVTVTENQKPVDKKELIALINKAEEDKKDVLISSDGKDIDIDKIWVDAEIMTGYEKSIADAKSVSWKAKVEIQEIDKAIKNLKISINEFNSAKQSGSKKPIQDIAQYKAVLRDTLSYIHDNNSNPQLGSEWSMISLARGESEFSKAYADGYYDQLKTQISKLKKGTDYSRIILSLTSLGKNIENVNGYNLLEKMADFNYIEKQGINGPIFSLIATNSNNYEIPVVPGVEVQNSKAKMVEYILANEVPGGGWALYGNKADPDITAMAIQGLAPYYLEGNQNVKTAVDKALIVLSDMQLADGGYASWGTQNSESTAQVIVALCELKKDPLDENNGFVKNGKNLLDGILKYSVVGGGFKHILAETTPNGMATDQGAYALAAYDRFVNGKTSLYNMTDVEFNIDKIELENQINIAASSDKSKYTSASWKQMKNVLMEAKKINGKPTSKQGEIDIAANNLKEAIINLEAKSIENILIENGKVNIPQDNEKNFEITVPSDKKVEITIPENTESKVTLKLKTKKAISGIRGIKGNNKIEIPEGTVITQGSGDLELFGTKTEDEKLKIQNNIKELIKQTDEKVQSVTVEQAFKFGDVETVTFDGYVEILFSGMAGKGAAYIDGSGIHIIQSVKNDAEGQSKNEYVIDSGKDLIIKTKHFTDFIIYSPEKEPEHTGNGGNTSSQEKTVTISIDKKTIDKGYVIEPTVVKIRSGQTVWDILKREMDNRGIVYEHEFTPKYGSIYVQSIAGDGEFDHGRWSGWMYNVNGVYPMFGCDKYILNGGETIQWRYTKDLGLDLGQDNSAWGAPGGGGAAAAKEKGTTLLNPDTIIINDEARAEVDSKFINGMVSEVVEKKLNQIIIEPKIDSKAKVNKITIVLEKESIEKISSQTKAVLKLKTQLADIKLSNKALAGLAKEKGNTVTISVIANKDGSTGFEIKAGLDTVGKIASGITAIIPVTEASSSTVAVQMMPDGTEKILIKSITEGNYLNARLDGSATVKIMENKKTYADTANHWAKDAIEFAGAREILKGTSAEKFSPNATMTKGMLVTLLHRFENEESVQGKAYDDVKSDAYYANAAIWAQVKGIAEGETDTQFQPNQEVTREQLATMIYNYAKFSGEDVSSTSEDKIKTFEDWNNTSKESQEAMKYCYNNNIIGGKSDTVLDPQGKTTRAEVSAIIQRYISKTTI